MKKWKKVLAAVCTASMLMTMPGMSVLADELIEEDSVVLDFEEQEQDAEEPEQLEEVLPADEEPEQPEEVLPADEELVGTGTITVGDGVTATFDEKTGEVEFYSDGGTLWNDWLDQSGLDMLSIESIKVAEGTVYLPEDSAEIFKLGYTNTYGGRDYQTNLKVLDLHGFDTSKVTNMASMFSCCYKLTSLDLSGFDTSNVTYMSSMFNGCGSLTTLDLSSFDTSNVTFMGGMFKDCRNLKTLNLSGFDMSNVTSVLSMFSYCGFTSLDLTGINTGNVTDMRRMFYCCSNLKTLDLRKLDTQNVTDMGEMFSGCSSLTSLDMSNLNTSNVESMRNMFGECYSLTSLKLSGIDVSNVKDFWCMFSECRSLTSLDLSSFTTSSAVNMGDMFADCHSLTSLDLSSFITSSVTNMEAMFLNCISLKSLDLSNFDTSKLVCSNYIFSDCYALELLKTPKKNKISIILPAMMFDFDGVPYEVLPVLTESMVFTRKRVTHEPTPTPTPTPPPAASGFSDVVNPRHPYYNAIYWAADAGITKGYADGTFGINKSCTRGEMIMFLWRFVRKPEPKAVSKSPFKDVNKSHAFYKAILWAYQKGITKGYPDGTFGINKNVSRGECMMFLWRVKGKPAPKAAAKSPFKDVPKNHVFYNAILWGSQNKITTGYTSGAKKGTFGIKENCTRGQIVTFLYRAK